MRKAIVFIETRNFPGLRKIFEDHLEYVDLEPAVICSKDNSFQFFGYKQIIVSDPGSRYGYNKMITSPDFWKEIPFDKVLICERESGILRKGIEEFYEWDYVGAPWIFQHHGGNGGFSWRSVKSMIEVSSRYAIGGENEDVFFCNHFIGRMAPREVCERFSVEGIFKLGTFGYHFGSDSDRLLTKEEKKTILNQYGRQGHT